jgi:hypothetical protein
MLLLPVTANVVPSSLIPFTLMIIATSSSELSVLTRATRRHALQCGIYQASLSFSRENEVSLVHAAENYRKVKIRGKSE